MRKQVAVVSAVVVILTAGVAGAQQKDSNNVPQLMEEVVVTATRAEQRVEKVPANVSVITRADIENSNAERITDLLRFEEGLVVRDLLGHGKNAQVDLRGFGETAAFNTLVLVDGRRVNEIDLSGVDWTQIPLDQIERVEILRGTGSVLYGDNAVGGVINIITRSPLPGIGGSAGFTYGSYDRLKGEATVSGRQGRVAGSLFASAETTDGYRDRNDFEATDIGGKLIFDFSEILSLKLNGSYHEDDFKLTGPLTKAELAADRKANTRPFDAAETEDYYVSATFDIDMQNYGSLSVDFSLRDRQTSARFVTFISANQTDVKTSGITPRYTWEGSLGGHSNTLVAGADFYFIDSDARSFFAFAPPIPSSPTGITNVDRNAYGFYVHDEFSITPDLILAVGTRQEKVEYDLDVRDLTGFLAPLKDSVSEREHAYSAGLTYLYDKGSSVFLRANRSFRFPLVDEIVVFDFFAGQINVNQDLKPQSGMHYEAGVRHFFTPQIQANVTVFQAKIEDEIFFNNVAFANENHPETLHQGVEVGAKVGLFDKATIYGNFTYERAEFEKEPFKGNEIPAVPDRKGNVGLNLYNVIPHVTFNAQYNYVGESFAISDQGNAFEKLDSWQTLDLRLSYEWKMLKAFVGVNNITDEEYSEYAVISGATGINFYPAPERNYVGGIELTF